MRCISMRNLTQDGDHLEAFQSTNKDLERINKPTLNQKTKKLHIKEEIPQLNKALTEITQTLLKRQRAPSQFLENHKITIMERARMVDWMIEVISVYELSQSTLFLAVGLMDDFSVATKQTLIAENDIHLMGITSLYIASKYIDQTPLSMQNVLTISYGAFTIQNLWEAERLILFNTCFRVDSPTVHHFVSLLLSGFDTKLQVRLRQKCMLLARMALIDYTISISSSNSLIAGGIILLVLSKHFQTSMLKSYITPLIGCEEGDLIIIAQKITLMNDNFKKNFASYENVYKFQFGEKQCTADKNKENIDLNHQRI